MSVQGQKKWDEVPENIKELLVNNVYCRNCGVTTIVDYEPSLSDGLVVLEVNLVTNDDKRQAVKINNVNDEFNNLAEDQ